jgi:putative transposase
MAFETHVLQIASASGSTLVDRRSCFDRLVGPQFVSVRQEDFEQTSLALSALNRARSFDERPRAGSVVRQIDRRNGIERLVAAGRWRSVQFNHLRGRFFTPNPSAPWVTQQARQLTWTLAERPESFRFLIRDRDQQFTDGFDDVFRSSGLEIIRTPVRTPQANAVAERFVRTVRSECLDRLLILNEQHLERILDVFVEHYNGHRPHRALALTPPRPTRQPVAPATECSEARVQRRDRFGGVVHEYVLAA